MSGETLRLTPQSPEVLADLGDGDLRAAGLSRPKIRYMRDLSEKIISREITLSEIPGMQDEDIIARLTKVKGIGRWTVEMLLIFTLGRPDVFAVDDLGLRKAVQWLYGLDEMPKKKVMERYGERWRPHRTVASLYLWQAINRKMTSSPSIPSTGDRHL